MKLLRPIILEGPDGAGKSTLFDLMTGSWGLKSAGQDGGPVASQEDAWKRLAMTAAQGCAVRDRTPAISDHIYSEVFGRTPGLKRMDYDTWLRVFDPYIVYCRPPLETILKQEVKQKLHKPEDHVEVVKANRSRIVDLYDYDIKSRDLLLDLDIYTYDWTRDTGAVKLKTELFELGVICAE
jgi:hypothetical protein